jgi:hypothetical protein
MSVERDSLGQEYREAVQNYIETIRDLAALVDISVTDSEFDLAHLRISAARDACEVAQAARNFHLAKHGF